MCTIYFQGKKAQNHAQETVLETFLRHSIEIPFSCRQGICHTCTLKATHGEIPSKAQKGLSQTAIEQNHFLPCVCLPIADMEVEQINEQEKHYQGVIIQKELLSPDVCELSIEIAEDISFQAGQYIQLKKNGTQAFRPYSISSVPYIDSHICLHIKHIPNGQFSQWIFEELQEGDAIEFKAPQGSCHYSENISPESPLLLIGTGTGLSPLVGIIKQALWIYDHQGPIYLYHGSSFATGIYYHDQLMELTDIHPNVHYSPFISKEEHHLYPRGRASEIALQNHPDLSGYRVFICGNPDMVETIGKEALNLGLKPKNLYKDPFTFQQNKVQNTIDSSYEFQEEDPSFPAPDLEIWAALDEGKLLTEILTDFYTKVYKDPLLLPFFESVTLRRAVEKQYSFLYQAFTGRQVYLGEMPRNAHNWMVITDEIFDHREALFEESLRKYHIEEKLIKRWLALDERYRSRLVKAHPWNKIIDGVAFPLGSFEELIAEIPMLCDNCEDEILEGEYVRYHSRLGKTYCSKCFR